MRSLEINKEHFWYCQYAGKEERLNEKGNFTGTYITYYEKPVNAKGCISTAKSNDSIETFGVDLDYDKTIIIDDRSYPIDEQTLIFIEKEPEWDEESKTLNNRDYVIKKIAKSLNVIQIAIKKVGKDNA